MSAVYCTVYRCSRAVETYLYVERADDFERVPEALLLRLGTLERVMELELYPGRRLARADAAAVIAALRENGFYLQMPPREHLARAN